LYTPDEKAFMIEEDAKCDSCLMPVYRTDNGGVAWILYHYCSDDTPSVAIGRRYPTEVFEYIETSGGIVYSHVKYINEKDIYNYLLEEKN
jgi:hypothetical protein